MEEDEAEDYREKKKLGWDFSPSYVYFFQPGLESAERNLVGSADLGEAREPFHRYIIPGDNDLCDCMILKNLL